MEVNRNESNLQNSRNTIEIPEREYNFKHMLDLFKGKEQSTDKVIKKKQIIKNDKKQEDKVDRPTNLNMTSNTINNQTNDTTKCKSDGLTDAQFIREMFGGLAQELEGFGPACREFIPVFKELGTNTENQLPISNEIDITHVEIMPIEDDQSIPPDKEAEEGSMYTYTDLKKFWDDRCKI